jgi:hypothetical protein
MEEEEERFLLPSSSPVRWQEIQSLLHPVSSVDALIEKISALSFEEKKTATGS